MASRQQQSHTRKPVPTALPPTYGGLKKNPASGYRLQ
jgi:hypothetical protein